LHKELSDSLMLTKPVKLLPQELSNPENVFSQKGMLTSFQSFIRYKSFSFLAKD
tara:strand:+ start:114 stop:275 length:162 start_codon:yes stop_codon:yes gene_type:complete